ncbi:RDD family protein [Pseudoalteromonas denitrificans]|uniref:RDD family protein n=1 Tax=Pseudoalteromonas denitrificans DSM 6059 TaxID=1123010 RepID=A0A1I1UTI4_9GAMM|nr:RDD family protein [Pseudoalteromonas denitrificans]SFD74004.1 RDD family protein [Pseudoalteromonas denitrificans DSM 6059]
MEPKEFKELHLSTEETREIITPYAFKINKALLGLPLASPNRRGIAILIDVFFIFVAAKLSAALISVVAALAFYRGMNDKYLPQTKSWLRKLLKFISAFVLFIAISSLLAESIDYFDTNDGLIKISTETELTDKQKKDIQIYLKATKAKECEIKCQQLALDKLKNKHPDIFDDGFFENDITGVTEPKIVRSILWGIYEGVKADEKKENITSTKKALNSPLETDHSLVEWLKVLVTDLGLGFGWAAVYFTLFTLLWRGQTLGKKMMGIRVITLSGEYLNAWDAFGRYGGYGAGFATGLLGFMQIYWDPNRQAIQDKISATVVIKGDLPKNDETNIKSD